MTYRIENLASGTVLILLNDNSLVSLEPSEALDALPAEEINNNSAVQKLHKWGLIALDRVEAPRAGTGQLTAANPT